MNIRNTHKDILVWVKQFTLFAVFMAAGLTAFAQTPEYATFTGGVSGTGEFTCSEMPNFTYLVSGDIAPGDTNIPGVAQVVDNNGGGMEVVFGQADAEQNIQVEVAGYGGGNGGGIGDPITNTVTTTLDFDTPTPPNSLAFLVADIEQDQVTICAFDSDGAPVSAAVINSWFQASFDADNSDATSSPPTWDAANSTLVGEFGAGGVKQTNYVADLSDNEAGAAWFRVNIAITKLELKFQAMGVNPDDPSYHLFVATTCEEPTCMDLLNDPLICDYIIDNPNSAIAQDDCDGGGISNLVECQTGENPSDPSDDCMSLMDAGLDICTILANDPTNGLATQDCDNGGVDNLTECNDNKDPKDPTDDIPLNPCEAPIGCSPVPTLDVCTDGTTRTIGCDTGLENANVVWYNGMGVQVGVGCDLVIDNTMIQNGLVGDMMCFYYIAEDPANPGCEITSCCPIIAQVIDCGFYDLALIKQEIPAGTYMPGDDVTFEITVCNQGTKDASNVEITDLIPTDMSLSAADNNGWAGPAAGPVTNTINSIVAASCEVLNIVLTIDDDFMGTSIVNNAVITADDGDDIDSDPDVIVMLNDFDDDNDLTEADGGDDEDPAEITVTQVYDLALTKTTPSNGPFNLLDEILYTITVCNQGTIDAANVQVTDYIPAGMRLAPSDANGWAGSIFGPVTNTIPSISAGTCETVDILLRIRSNFQGTTLINYAEISADDGDDIDSAPDQTNGNDAGGNPESASDDVLLGDGSGTPGDSVAATDEDDHDPELINVIQVYDLALKKETTNAGPYNTGDDVTYTITVCNQGTLPGSNIEVTDYIPTGMTLSANDANGWTGPIAGPVTYSFSSVPVNTCATVDIVLTIDAGFMGSSIVNYAEISGDNGDDVDSAPDAINGNDAGGNPNSPADNELGGDGTGSPNDSVAATDEDDHDPEEISLVQVFDLALIKEAPAGPYNAGDDVTYTITVSNQGTLDATSFEVTDYIPAGMTLSAADANGWAGPAAGPVSVTGGALAAGASTTIDIVLTIDAGFQGDEIVNFAEISADDNALGEPDVDSTPDADDTNDAGGAPDTASDDVNMGDGSGAPGDTNPATDEDDHDPESIIIGQVFDLALIKELSSAGPFGPGDDVTYTITVTNQGSLDATSFEVTDYIPAGMTLSAADANGWAGPAAGPVSVAGGALAAGATTTIDIVLTIDPTFSGEELVNFAEISADDNALGEPDVDSAPDADDTNDAGGAPDTASDDVNMGDGSGAPGDTNPATDEDDHDPEQIAVQQPLSIGSTVFADLDDSGIQDAGEAGISGVTVELVDAATGAVIGTVVTDANGDYFFDMLAPGDYIVQIPMPDAVYPTSSTPTDTADNGVDGNDNGDQPGGSGTIVQSPVITLAPGTEPTGVAEGAPTGGAQDDILDANGDMTIDFGFIPIYDLALVKQASDPDGTTYSPGDDVPYTITVCNQGTVDAANVEVTDYIPTGMTLSGADANGWAGAAAGPVTNTLAIVPAGTCTTVDIILTIDASFMGSSLVNFAEISSDDGDDIDSTPDTDNTNDAGGNPDSPSDDEFMGDGTGTPGDSVAATDEDDHDPEEILLEQVYDLALTKETASAGPFDAGDDITYIIEVCNQGTLDAAFVEVTDYIPAGMTLSAADANGWAGAAVGPVTNTIASLPAGVCTTVEIVLTIDAGFQGTSLVNFAEISNDNGDDVDSTPDSDDTNDAGGAPDSPSDDVNMGDGTGTPGGTDPATDEDDHDPELIMVNQVYDLALNKKEAGAGPYNAGDDVTYTIEVCNQGTLDAAFAEVTDYIPAGMSLSGADANGWAGPAVGPVTTTVTNLVAGACTTVDIILTIDANFMGSSLVNFAEISNDDGDDIDSTPDADDTNDAGGAPNSPADDFTMGDGTGAPGDSVAATDEDDHDPEEIMLVQTYDLALVKTESSAGPYSAGDDVTYTIEVCNQGTLDAANIEVTDYIPAEMTLSAADANGWAGPGVGPVTNTIASLASGACTSVDIVLTIDPAFQGTSIVNFAEISGDDGDDIDSTPDANDANDAGGNPNSPSDDVNMGDGTGAPGDSVAATDEDDHDPEEITLVQEYDLALTKKESSAGPYFPGDDVTYTIEVCNQGTLDAANVEVTDYIPADMMLSGADANGWAGPNAGPVTITIASLPTGACTTVDIVLTIDAAFAGGTIVNFAEISADDGDDIDSTPDANDANDAGGNPDSPSDDVVNGDGTGVPGDSVGATDEDDHDPESIVVEEVYDLALIKEESSAGPYLPGDDVTYTITIENQGTAMANSFQVTDYIPANMTLSAADANGWAGPAAGPVTNNIIMPLAPGATTSVDIVLTIDPNFAGGSLVNFAEISFDDGADVDSTPDAINGNDAGGNPNSASDDSNDGDGTGAPNDTDPATDEDDHDPEEIVVEMIYDLALIKEVSSAGPYMPGDDVTYTITVENQGTLPANLFQITDYIPAGMTLSANDANGWAGPGAGPVSTNIIAPLAPGASTTVDIVLTIDANFSGNSLVNYAEISFDDGDDVDSAPDTTNGNDAGGAPNTTSDNVVDGDGTGAPNDTDPATDEDDHDPEEIPVSAIYDLALTKVESSAGPYFPGDDVTYTIEVCNQGTLPASNVTVTDYIPSDMMLSAADANGWAGPSAGPVTNTLSSVPVGTCQTVDIVLTINSSFTGTSIVNFAEISGDDGNDIDSTPDADDTNDAGGNPNSPSDNVVMGDGTGTPGDSVAATDEDDHDPEEVTVGQIYDLALIKEVTSAGPYSSGDDVTYTITVENQGSIMANVFQITDYIPAGMTLSANDTNGWAGPSAGPVTLNVIGALAPGASTTVDITLTIDPTYMGGTLVNFAEISFDDGDDFDSAPDGINGNDAGGEPDTASDDVNMGDGSGLPGDIDPATDEDDHDPAAIEACPAADAGILAEGSADSCLPVGGSIKRNAIATGQVVPAGDSLVYILVDMAGNILQVDSIPEFIISNVGDYTIHPVVYNPLDCDVSLAGTVTDILTACNCIAIDLVGAPVSVRECCTANSGGLINGTATGCADPGVADATLTATSVGLNIPPGSTVGYILTSGPASIIQATNSTPSFDVDMAGTYAIHTIVYDPLTYSLSTINIDVDDIFSVNTTINTTEACANVDLLGLDIIAETCTNDCPFDLYIPGVGVQVTPGLYEVQNDITSDGLVNVGPVEYSAGNSVELLPGFEVTLGTEFEAYIEGCN